MGATTVNNVYSPSCCTAKISPGSWAGPEPGPKPEPKPEKKTRFALQLSSFQDKAEAQAYLEQVKGNGLPAYVTEAEVDGKTFYRVRVGRYLSIDAASDAKVDIDKATKKSATVVKLAN